MASNFEKVVDFNYQFGVLKSKDLKSLPNIFTEDPNQVEFALKLIREEVGELEQAVKDKNYIEAIDALGDILYVVYGMAARIGNDMNKTFDRIHENNMSKLCKTENEAIETVKYYEENKEKLGYDSPCYKLAPDNIHWVVYNKSTNKVLKAKSWKPVDLSNLCQ